jgi:hypothetical protein
MINFASRFTIGKAHGWGTFPKCKARLGYCLIQSPLFWECPHPRALGHVPRPGLRLEPQNTTPNQIWVLGLGCGTRVSLLLGQLLCHRHGSGSRALLRTSTTCACIPSNHSRSVCIVLAYFNSLHAVFFPCGGSEYIIFFAVRGGFGFSLRIQLVS